MSATFAQAMRRREEAAEREIEALARADLYDTIENGPKLWEALQSWLNVDARLYDERLGLIAKHLQALLNGVPVDCATNMTYQQRREVSSSLAKCNAREWLREVITDYITEDMVQNRVEEMEREDAEEAA